MGDADRTRDRILKATARLLAKRGFQALGVNAIAEAARVGKPLIYRYFGGLEGLLAAVGESQEFWPAADALVGADAPGETYPTLTSRALVRYLQELRARPKTLEILGWQLFETNPLTLALDAGLARTGRAVFAEIRRRTGPPPLHADAAALHAVLLGAVFFLVLRARVSGEFAGLSLKSDEDWARVESALRHLVERAYDAPVLPTAP